MIEWILEVTTENLTNRRIANKKKANMYERLHFRIDDQIKYCISCKRTWKRNRKMDGRDYEYYPKSHIPTIGKEKLKCPNCKENNKNENTFNQS